MLILKQILTEFKNSDKREDNLYFLAAIKELTVLMERLYSLKPDNGLIESIDNFYRIIEKYDKNKPGFKI